MALVIIILAVTGITIPLFIYLTIQNFMYLLIVFLLTLVVLIYLYFRFDQFSKKEQRKNFMFALIELFILNFDVQKSVDATLPIVFPLLPVNKDKKVFNYSKGFNRDQFS